jgi:hypothetical protein
MLCCAFALLVAGLLCVVQQPRAHVPTTGAGRLVRATTPFGLDGVANGAGSATLTTTYTDLIIYVVAFSGAGGLHAQSPRCNSNLPGVNLMVTNQAHPESDGVRLDHATGGGLGHADVRGAQAGQALELPPQG